MRSVLSALALAIPLAAIVPASGQEGGAVATGGGVALKICARCHVVSADQPRAPILTPPAPSFSDIAARPDVTEASLRRFLVEPHGEQRQLSAMPGFLMPGSQIDAVVAYIMSLKPKPKP
jgi:mono/diheme cytochrome c family protein